VPYPPSAIDDALAEKLVDAAIDRAAGSDSPKTRALTPAALEAVMDDYRALADDAAADAPRRAAAWADRFGIPHDRLVMDEFGAIREDPAGRRFPKAGRMAYLADKRAAAEAEGIAWAVWSWIGSMGIAGTDAERDIDPEVCAALGLAGC